MIYGAEEPLGYVSEGGGNDYNLYCPGGRNHSHFRRVYRESQIVLSLDNIRAKFFTATKFDISAV